MKGTLFLILLLFHSVKILGSDTITLENSRIDYPVRGGTISILEDRTNQLTIEKILNNESLNLNAFEKTQSDIPDIKRFSSAYWVKINYINKSDNLHWVFEMFDFRIDSMEVYIPDAQGRYIKYSAGDQFKFSQKQYSHKNFAFNISPPKNVPQTIYVKVKTSHPIGIVGVIRTNEEFLYYATTEYYLLALFYGIVFAMACYNLFLFIIIKDKSYLFYVLYAFSTMIYSLAHDGTGFEYFWPDHPALNSFLDKIALFSMVIFAMLYAKYFLNIKQYSSVINRLIHLVIVFKITLSIISIFFIPDFLYIPYFDIIPLVIVYIAAIIILKKGFTPARYFIIAFTLLMIGFMITSLESVRIVPNNWFTVYSLNLGVVSEMLLLSLALADRIRVLRLEKDVAKSEIIAQLSENEKLKDSLNKELEQQVQDRTKELQEKNKQLDTFVYKASHDIKGPLKSIIGLTKVGLKDITDESAKTYFEHILKSTTRLDNILKDLLNLTKVQQMEIQPVIINFGQIIKEVLNSFEHSPGFSKIKITVNDEPELVFYSDEKLMYSIIQNFIENGYKYRDLKKHEQSIEIKIMENENGVCIEVKDNGIGIEKDIQEKVFDMFFKVNSDSVGTGLGLHIVKIGVEKLGGKISLDSTPGVGSTFRIEIPNQSVNILN